jgi:BMFP domain-containing protein YqiC
MQTDNRFIDDFARAVSGALGAISGVRSEMEAQLRSAAERLFAGGQFVTREEFEVVREMAAKARGENEELRARIVRLEAMLGAAGQPATGGPG